jgi:mRNA degradation ribonuclease J1/J2
LANYPKSYQCKFTISPDYDQASGRSTKESSAAVFGNVIYSCEKAQTPRISGHEKRSKKVFGMGRKQINCSGHAKGRDLFQIVKAIDAKLLFPIHTEHLEMYVRVTRTLTLVEEGKPYHV